MSILLSNDESCKGFSPRGMNHRCPQSAEQVSSASRQSCYTGGYE